MSEILVKRDQSLNPHGLSYMIGVHKPPYFTTKQSQKPHLYVVLAISVADSYIYTIKPWEQFRDLIPENERDCFITAYHKRLNSENLETQGMKESWFIPTKLAINLSISLSDASSRKQANCIKSELMLCCVLVCVYARYLLSFSVSGEQGFLDERVLGASAHSDYGMMTLLMTDGIPGLQVCREKSKQPHIWENVHHISGDLFEWIEIEPMQFWHSLLFMDQVSRYD
ncbi:hypothetical protein POM88_053275 [Heracleum sosnowskyi]|uniref:Isopenicillin N synthase-like Fe(2+) 2OG dioxygenase domain-containing protein n=1 Tax=Heracleum sosnowskyi TaxID=360622 RepID=A0AAD8LY06_9APIA|nr:hypothetical protein POM88_053275 [Heracleum sosnowskyi]